MLSCVLLAVPFLAPESCTSDPLSPGLSSCSTDAVVLRA
jgi:hypothetical protein